MQDYQMTYRKWITFDRYNDSQKVMVCVDHITSISDTGRNTTRITTTDGDKFEVQATFEDVQKAITGDQV